MKTSAILFFIFMLIGGVLGLAILQDPGHVRIRYDDIVVETSLWASLAMIVVFLLISLALISLTKWLFSLPKAYDVWKQKKQEKSLFYKAELGMLAMAENRWLDAKSLLMEAADGSDRPLIYLLCAARAAHNLRALDDREKLLNKISAISKGTDQTLSFMRAEFYMDEGRYREAAHLLSDLRVKNQISQFWLGRLLDCYKALGEERKIELLLPEVNRLELLNQSN